VEELVDCAGLTWRLAADRSAAISIPAATDDSAITIAINRQADAAGGDDDHPTLPCIASSHRLLTLLLLPPINLHVIFTTTNDSQR